MSVYEMLFPKAAPDLARHFLILIKIPAGEYRLRDTWVERHEGEPVIRILTRLGGGNRADYAAQIRELQQHPLYIRDHDETEWDSTYASFYFRLDPRLPKQIIDMFTAAEREPVNMKQRAEKALEAASARWERGEFTDAEKELRDTLASGLGGIIEI